MLQLSFVKENESRYTTVWFKSTSITHHTTTVAGASCQEVPEGRKWKQIILDGSHLLLMVKNNRVSTLTKLTDVQELPSYTRAHGLRGASCKAALEMWMKNARSGHPPIIFIMKSSRRQGRRDEDGGGGGNERLKNKRKFASCSGATSGSRRARTRMVNWGAAGVNCELFFPSH